MPIQPANPPDVHFAVAAVILAAGRSSRMGRHKLLLPWGETSVVGHLIHQWSELHAAPVVVVGAQGDVALGAELERLNFPAENRVLNPAPDADMFSSIKCAARYASWAPTITHWAIILGDQPHLRGKVLKQILAFAREHPGKISQPARQGRGRHPVILPRRDFFELATTTGGTLKEFLSAAEEKIARLEMADAAFDLDIDYPADYKAALRLRSP